MSYIGLQARAAAGSKIALPDCRRSRCVLAGLDQRADLGRRLLVHLPYAVHRSGVLRYLLHHLLLGFTRGLATASGEYRVALKHPCHCRFSCSAFRLYSGRDMASACSSVSSMPCASLAWRCAWDTMDLRSSERTVKPHGHWTTVVMALSFCDSGTEYLARAWPGLGKTLVFPPHPQQRTITGDAENLPRRAA
jgi:hypothetical protein